ncbi:hypothetical protein SESBI_20665 [Sesbania bispinosa]|nr:hypothetical protein SESBI_20665 [Sesbania bispinosa]
MVAPPLPTFHGLLFSSFSSSRSQLLDHDLTFAASRSRPPVCGLFFTASPLQRTAPDDATSLSRRTVACPLSPPLRRTVAMAGVQWPLTDSTHRSSEPSPSFLCFLLCLFFCFFYSLTVFQFRQF